MNEPILFDLKSASRCLGTKLHIVKRYIKAKLISSTVKNNQPMISLVDIKSFIEKYNYPPKQLELF